MRVTKINVAHVSAGSPKLTVIKPEIVANPYAAMAVKTPYYQLEAQLRDEKQRAMDLEQQLEQRNEVIKNLEDQLSSQNNYNQSQQQANQVSLAQANESLSQLHVSKAAADSRILELEMILAEKERILARALEDQERLNEVSQSNALLQSQLCELQERYEASEAGHRMSSAGLESSQSNERQLLSQLCDLQERYKASEAECTRLGETLESLKSNEQALNQLLDEKTALNGDISGLLEKMHLIEEEVKTLRFINSDYETIANLNEDQKNQVSDLYKGLQSTNEGKRALDVLRLRTEMRAICEDLNKIEISCNNFLPSDESLIEGNEESTKININSILDKVSFLNERFETILADGLKAQAIEQNVEQQATELEENPQGTFLRASYNLEDGFRNLRELMIISKQNPRDVETQKKVRAATDEFRIIAKQNQASLRNNKAVFSEVNKIISELLEILPNGEGLGDEEPQPLLNEILELVAKLKTLVEPALKDSSYESFKDMRVAQGELDSIDKENEDRIKEVNSSFMEHVSGFIKDDITQSNRESIAEAHKNLTTSLNQLLDTQSYATECKRYEEELNSKKEFIKILLRNLKPSTSSPTANRLLPNILTKAPEGAVTDFQKLCKELDTVRNTVKKYIETKTFEFSNPKKCIQSIKQNLDPLANYINQKMSQARSEEDQDMLNALTAYRTHVISANELMLSYEGFSQELASSLRENYIRHLRACLASFSAELDKLIKATLGRLETSPQTSPKGR